MSHAEIAADKDEFDVGTLDTEEISVAAQTLIAIDAINHILAELIISAGVPRRLAIDAFMGVASEADGHPGGKVTNLLARQLAMHLAEIDPNKAGPH